VKFFEVCCFQVFHIGGDENNGKEWNANPVIQKNLRIK
jgi:hexosaminidase